MRFIGELTGVLVIISHNFKFVFIHIPKCAGTSIRNRLLELDPEAVSFWGKEWAPHLGRQVDAAHRPIEDLIMLDELKQILREYFVFAFVRNPYERFLSSIAEFRRECSESLNVSEVETLLSSLTPNTLRSDVTYVHFCPMRYFTHVGNKRWVDEIYDFADLEAGLVRFSRAVGISPGKVLPLQSFNVSKRLRRPSENILTSKVIKAINNIYSQDFELFGYDRIEIDSEEVPSFTELSPAAEIRAKPEQLQIIAPVLREMKKLDDERRALLEERERLLGVLHHIYDHIVFGSLLKLWGRYINQNFPLAPMSQFSDEKSQK